jgi:murein L,D-transpeptidase YcbB/YkuD
MRGRSSVAILGAAVVLVLAAVLAVLLASGGRQETAASSIVVAIPDNPAALAANEAQEAELVAALPGATDEPAGEETGAAPAVAEKLFIADTIRLKLNDAALRRNAHADDLAAVESLYAAQNGAALWVTTAGLTPEAQTILGEIAKADDWGLDLGMFTVPPADYVPAVTEDQAATEIALSLAILKYARAARGGLVEPSAVSKVFDQKPPLREPASVLTEIVATPTPDTYLTDLHPKHEQFARLRTALLKAQSDEDRVRLEANLNRWRWMPETLGPSYVWLNIPEFMVHVVKDGKTVHSEKLVVGNPNSPTPVLSADLKSIVFNPERTVPMSIIRRDVLPKLQKGTNWFGGSSTSVLEQYQLTVKYKGKPVDPSQIDWEKINLSTLTFVQAPGPTNILGKVQFLYPNDRDVYLHDTIIRSQLGRVVRAEGQQEPRVANPDELAAVLLAADKGWAKAKVDKLIADRRTVEVKIDKPIPVHTTYFTAVVDEQGQVKTFDDIYKIDKRDDAAAASPPVADKAPIPPRKPVSGSLAASAP